MRETGTSRRDTAIAAACALLLHVGLGWGVNELLRMKPATAETETETETDDDALQVVWIAPVDVTTPTPDVSLPVPARLARVMTPTAKPAAALVDPPTPATPSGKPLSVVALGQARRWARRQAPLEFAATDAFADRAVDLPGRPADRFRVTASLSPAEVVGLIGMTFGGAGPDPCIRNRENIAGYATGRDEKVLQLELELERRHCRP